MNRKLGVLLAAMLISVPTARAQLGNIDFSPLPGESVSLDIPGFLNSSNFTVSLDLGGPVSYELSFSVDGGGSGYVSITLAITHVYVHDGPPDAPAFDWVSLGPVDFGDTNTTALTDSISALSHTGKTYRLVGSATGLVSVVVPSFPEIEAPLDVDIDAIFYLPYPMMTNPIVAIYPPDGSNGLLVIEYLDGLYSNSVALPIGPEATQFYRLYSPDEDPTNAVIQFSESLDAVNWQSP